MSDAPSARVAGATLFQKEPDVPETNYRARIAVLAITTWLVCSTAADADHKPSHNSGGGKPGGGGGTQPRFSVLEIPIHNAFPRLSEADSDGIITVAIEGAEAGYVSAAFARVNRNDGALLSYGFLPEPMFVDPNDGVEKNGGSSAADVNSAGTIVGSASTYDPASADVSPTRAYRWLYDGAGYTKTALPELPGAVHSSAAAINSQGDIVGGMVTAAGGRAVYWDADSLAINDLNTLVDAASDGWELQWATDINDQGRITGVGQLDGESRGFVLDITTQQISAVPLVGEAHANMAAQINSQGRVIGDMWEENGGAFGLNPGFYSAYSWNESESTPELLASATNNTSIAIGLNDGDSTVGASIIATGDFLADDTVATLWEPDDAGVIQAINLREQIPNKPEYRLDWALDINNDGWIGVHGRKFHKGQYSWPALLLVPNASSVAALAGAAIPEPSTHALLILGGVMLLRRRRPRAVRAGTRARLS